MPTEPPDPGVPQPFLDAVHTCRWERDHLIRPNSTETFPAVVDNAWTLAPSGMLISKSTYELLWGGIAQTDGSFVARGVRYHLHPDTTTNYAVAQKA